MSKSFFVAKSSGGYRLVVDLQMVNSHFVVQKVKFESLGMLHFANKGLAWGGKVDLSDAYHHIALHPDIQKYF